MADGKLTALAEPEQALASYLDELLHAATDAAKQEESGTQTQVAEAIPAPVPEAPPRIKADPQPQQEPKADAEVLPETDGPLAVTRPATEAPEAAGPQPGESGTPAAPDRPDWSLQPFECLLFSVAGLQLAVPLVLLGAIHRIEEGDEIRPMPGSPRWYLGIRPGRDGNLRVVDTAEWIMAGRAPANARDNYRFVIRLDDSNWGLACDDVAQSFTLTPEQVRWRTARSKRPWLAGTVIEHMCALIDVRTMADLLARAEREHHLDLG